MPSLRHLGNRYTSRDGQKSRSRKDRSAGLGCSDDGLEQVLQIEPQNHRVSRSKNDPSPFCPLVLCVTQLRSISPMTRSDLETESNCTASHCIASLLHMSERPLGLGKQRKDSTNSASVRPVLLGDDRELHTVISILHRLFNLPTEGFVYPAIGNIGSQD